MAEIKKIILQLGEKEIELSIAEAKNLKDSLNELFGKEVIKEVIHTYEPRWYYHSPTFTYPISATAPLIGTWVTGTNYDDTVLTLNYAERD